jgi:hypothetical protein
MGMPTKFANGSFFKRLVKKKRESKALPVSFQPFCSALSEAMS